MLVREKELQQLEKLYNSNKFEFLVLYGRKRIGKTTLLTAFALQIVYKYNISLDWLIGRLN